MNLPDAVDKDHCFYSICLGGGGAFKAGLQPRRGKRLFYFSDLQECGAGATTHPLHEAPGATRVNKDHSRSPKDHI